MASSQLHNTSDSARLDAEVLLAHALERDRSYLYTWPEREPPTAVATRFLQSIEQREHGVPVAYLTGTKEFWSMRFRVTSDTLVPRADTETLVQLAIDQLNLYPGPVLDLGTGCGAIAISIAKEYQRLTDNSTDNSTAMPVEVSAADASVPALNIARENARSLNANVSFYLSNWFTHLPRKKWQLVVSNPPYLSPHDKHLPSLKHEPRNALVAADNGLADIENIVLAAKYHLLTNATLMIEHGEEQGWSVRTLMQRAGYHSIRTETDIASRDRVTLGQMHE